MQIVSSWKRVNWLVVQKIITSKPLKEWNIALAVLFAFQGFVVMLFGNAYILPVNVLFLTTDSLQTQLAHHTVLAIAIRQLGTINLLYLVAAYFFVAAIAHVLAATFLRTQYETAVKKHVALLRWVEYSISVSLMLVIVGMLAGIYDLGSLLFMITLGLLAGLSGRWIEQRMAILAKQAAFMWLLRTVIMAVAIVPWLVIAVYVVAANVFSSNYHVPAYLYGVAFAAVLFIVAVGYNAYIAHVRKGQVTIDYAYAERRYMMLSFILRLLFAGQIFVAILRP